MSDTLYDEGQTDLENYLANRRPSDPLPGREAIPTFEVSVQSRYLDLHGRELPNPTPLAPPVGYKKQPTIAEQMRAMIRQASFEARQMGAETEEEANDFDVGEDFDPTTPYEHDFEMDPALEAMLALSSKPPRAPAAKPSAGPKQAPEGTEGGEAKPKA